MSTNLSWVTCQTTSTSGNTVRPASLAKHPNTWCKDEVRAWLRWCTEEFSIDNIPPEKFDLNGKALCLLSRSDFIERLPSNGDVLYNCLQTLVSKYVGTQLLCNTPQTGVSPDCSVVFTDPRIHLSDIASDSLTTRVLLLSPSPSVSPVTTALPVSAGAGLVASTTSTAFPAHTSNCPGVIPRTYIPIKPQPHRQSCNMPPLFDQKDGGLLTPNYCDMLTRRANGTPSPQGSPESTESTDTIRAELSPGVRSLNAFPHQQTDCRLLWEFIYQLLLNTNYSNYVSWENRDEFVFRIVNPTGLAELWGQQKNRTNMTYEKLSRALRYYYRMGIIRKVPGKRLTYQFLTSPSNIKKGQRGAKPHCKLQSSHNSSPNSGEKNAPEVKSECFSEEDNDVTSVSESRDPMKSEVKLENLDETVNNRTQRLPTHYGHGEEFNYTSLVRRETAPAVAHTGGRGSDCLEKRIPRILISEYDDTIDHSDLFAIDLSSRSKHLSAKHETTDLLQMPIPTRHSLSQPNDMFFRDIKQEHSAFNYLPFDLSKRNIFNRPRAIFMRSRSFEHIDIHSNGSLYGHNIEHARSVSPIAHVQSEPEDLSIDKTKHRSRNGDCADSPDISSATSDTND